MQAPGAALSEIMTGYPRCPVCDFGDRSPCDLEAMIPSPYTKAVADLVGMEAEALLAEAPLYACGRCRSTWHDPWLTKECSAWLYGQARALHRYGWTSLQWWVENRPTSFLETRRQIWKLLRQKAPGPLRYAEFNCPFNGLVFQEVTESHGDDARRLVVNRARALQGQPPPAEAAAGDREGFLVDRTLLMATSPMCWGEACLSHGVSCRDLATGLLFERVVPLEEAAAAGERFDLIGSFLTIDHVLEPNRTLFSLLTIGRRVLLELHLPGWTDLQHLYNIHPFFIELVRRNGVQVRNITRQAYAHDVKEPPTGTFVFVLSRHDDLAWLD